MASKTIKTVKPAPKKKPALTKPDVLYYHNIVMAEKYFQEQELIAIKNKNANEYDKRMKQIEHKQKVNERLKRWKEKRKIIFLTYREYLSHKEAGTLPERFRIKLLRLYGGKNDLHYK